MVPHDRSIYLDEAVGEFYDGYENIINEFYFRSGVTLDLREIRVTDDMVPVSILCTEYNGCLDPSVSAINTLSESSCLMWSLLDAYLSGSFQMLLYGNSDVSEALQLNSKLFSCQPLVLQSLGH